MTKKALLSAIITVGLIATVCEAKPKKRIDLALWLARSCVGEAGWNSVESGECAAIAWVYHKRSYMYPRRDYRRAMVDYSAAIRIGRPWIRALNRKGDRPPMLETNIHWGAHVKKWQATLDFADTFFKGRIPDPVPEALHYGGRMDRGRLDPRRWIVMDTPDFRNEFYALKENI